MHDLVVHLVSRCAGARGSTVHGVVRYIGALVHRVVRRTGAGARGSTVRRCTECYGTLAHGVLRCSGARRSTVHRCICARGFMWYGVPVHGVLRCTGAPVHGVVQCTGASARCTRMAYGLPVTWSAVPEGLTVHQ